MSITGLSSQLIFRFMSEQPFFYGVWGQLRTVWKAEKDFPHYGGVAFTGRGFTLYLNRDRWETLDDDSKLLLLCHECAHVALGHVPPDADVMQLNKQLVNIATDLVINEHFTQYKDTVLGKTIMWLENFPMLPQNIKDQDWRSIYQLLMAEAQEQQQGEGFDSHEFGDGQQPKDGEGEDGGSNGGIVELARVEQENVNRIAARHCQLRGQESSIPQQIAIELAKPKKPYIKMVQEILQRFVLSSRDTRKRSTWRRVSRRLGAVAKGRLSARLPKVAVAVDTSGSMCNEETITLMAEAVSAVCAVADIVEVVCGDTEVRSRGCVTSRDCITKFPGLVQGGGGTTLQPLLERLKADDSFDCVILITDGYCEVLDAVQPTVALITPGGVDAPGLKRSVHLQAAK